MRRRGGGLSVVFAVLFALSGCSGDEGGAAGYVAPRMFNVFHWEGTMEGYTHPGGAAGGLEIYGWASLYVAADGGLELTRHDCAEQIELQSFTWEHVGGGILRVIPGEVRADGTFIFGANPVVSVSLAPGPGCDDIEVTIEYPASSMQGSLNQHYLAGEICAEDLGGDCAFKFVWCEGTPPPMCTDM